MKDRTWKAAIWNLNWEDLAAGKYNVEGYCQFSANSGVHLDIPFGDLDLTRKLEETGFYAHSISEKRYPYIYGLTQDGYRLVICNALSIGSGRSSFGKTYETIEASTILESEHEFDPTSKISFIEFELEWLRDWLDLTRRFKDQRIINANNLHNIQIYSSDSTEIELCHGTNTLNKSNEGIFVPLVCYFRIKYINGALLDKAWSNEVQTIQSFFAFLFGAYPSVKWTTIYYEGNNFPVSLNCASTPEKSRDNISRLAPISFSNLSIPRLQKLASNWLSLDKEEYHAAEILTSLLINWNMPLELQFFAATAMLESLARTYSEDTLSKEEFKVLTNSVSEAINTIDISDKTIINRLNGLLGLLKHPSYSMLLDLAYENTKPWSDELIQDWNLFKKEQISFRHSGAHGTTKHNNNYMIVMYHYQAQIILAYVLLMKKLEFTDQEIDQFWRSSFMNVSRWNIKQHYALQK